MHQLISCIRREYLDMPGVALTLPQAARLWDVEEHRCRAALQALVSAGFLTLRDDGRFAVVSTAGLTSVQFRKLLSKSLGLLWFELPMSADSRSVLYDAVGGRVDLDLMSDDF